MASESILPKQKCYSYIHVTYVIVVSDPENFRPSFLNCIIYM